MNTKNEKTDITDKTLATFGCVHLAFCTWSFNMRVSDPDLEIFVAFNEISACFCYPRAFVDLVGVFGFILDLYTLQQTR